MTDSPARRQAALLAGNPRALWSLLASFFFSWISYTGSVALIGWLLFERTRSPAVVSIAFALRFLPMAFTGVLAGVLSDRFGRRFMLVAANGAQALLSFALAIVVGVHWATAPVLILAAGAYGVADSVRLVSGMNLTYDLTRRSHPLRGMALANLVSSGGQALGAVPWPDGYVPVSVLRGQDLQEPDPALTLTAGDRVCLLAPAAGHDNPSAAVGGS